MGNSSKSTQRSDDEYYVTIGYHEFDAGCETILPCEGRPYLNLIAEASTNLIL